MNTSNKNEPVVVFAGNTWQAGLLKSLLENAEIEAFLKDEVIGTLNPWWTASGGVGSVKVVVDSANYDKAMLVVEEFEKNLKQEENTDPNYYNEPETDA
ncbi:MAG: hypothetical protein FD170_784 [Bacteroidetes bacterium]|nr:MAG: hypothetical protein FD170_784 [Bacteroidota bacterium]